MTTCPSPRGGSPSASQGRGTSPARRRTAPGRPRPRPSVRPLTRVLPNGAASATPGCAAQGLHASRSTTLRENAEATSRRPLERERGDRQALQPGHPVVDQPDRQSAQQDHQHGDQRDHGTHEHEPPPREGQLAEGKERRSHRPHHLIDAMSANIPTWRRQPQLQVGDSSRSLARHVARRRSRAPQQAAVAAGVDVRICRCERVRGVLSPALDYAALSLRRVPWSEASRDAEHHCEPAAAPARCGHALAPSRLACRRLPCDRLDASFLTPPVVFRV